MHFYNKPQLSWYGFHTCIYKRNKMRKHSTNQFSANNAGQFKESKKHIPVKKNPRYIYTEEDLGEGILEAGIKMPYIVTRQDNQNLQPWN